MLVIIFFWCDVTEIEVSKDIKSLDPDKASGEDSISVKILTKVNNFISPLLSELTKHFRRSISK